MPKVHVPTFNESQDPFMNPDSWCDEQEIIQWVETWHEFPSWCSLKNRYQISSHGRVKSLLNANKIMVPHEAKRAKSSEYKSVYRLSLPLSRQVEVGIEVLLQIAFGDTLRAKGIEPDQDYPKSLRLDYVYTLEENKQVKKIDDDIVRDIRKRRETGETYVAIADKYNLRPEQCRKICIGQTYKHVV